MPDLDLSQDDPDEYEGRTIRWYGAEYVVGPWLSEGAERIIHSLMNTQSGLSLHLMKIFRDQQHAEERWRMEISGNALLRDNQVPVVLDDELVHAHGGWFELCEAADEQPPPLGTLMASARAAFEIGENDRATGFCHQVLDGNDDHTEALHLLARIASRQQDYEQSITIGSKVLSIEPNIRPYRFTLMEDLARVGSTSGFLTLLDEFKVKWPGDHRIDDLAAEVYLALGRPEDAAGLHLSMEYREDYFGNDALMEDFDRRLQDIRQRIQEDLQAKSEAAIEVTAAQSLLETGPPNDLIAHLERAHLLYPKDPYVTTNLGLALLRRGEWQRASTLFKEAIARGSDLIRDTCIASLAFAQAAGEEYDNAASLLDLVAHKLSGPDGIIQYWDLPARAVWVGPDKELIERPESVASLVRTVLDNQPLDGQHRDGLQALVDVYTNPPPG